MILFRISHEKHANLHGIGGISHSGRWNHAGNLVVYLSESASLAAWEKLMQYESVSNVPDGLVMLSVFVPDVIVEEFPFNEKKYLGWNSNPHNIFTMDYGSNFLQSERGLLLKVPSAVIRGEYNFVMNPVHPDFNECKITEIEPFSFDQRLIDMVK